MARLSLSVSVRKRASMVGTVSSTITFSKASKLKRLKRPPCSSPASVATACSQTMIIGTHSFAAIRLSMMFCIMPWVAQPVSSSPAPCIR